jgi:hypothetical protein
MDPSVINEPVPVASLSIVKTPATDSDPEASTVSAEPGFTVKSPFITIGSLIVAVVFELPIVKLE